MPEAWKQWEGRTVGDKFQLQRYLGGGDKSAVFLTEYAKLESRKAAIKLVAVEPDSSEAQISQWKQAAELSHPHLMRAFGVGRARLDGTELLYLVMEYAEEVLSQSILNQPLSAAEAADLIGPILDALAYLHGKGLVHARLKPSNILSVKEQLKISSDGLCRISEVRHSSWSPGVYDPPGISGRRISPSGDVWALGVTLVEALTQRLPDRNEPETLPGPFHDIVIHCLQPDPQYRWTIAEIGTKLRVSASATPVRQAGPANWWRDVLLWQLQCPRCASSDLMRSRRRNAVERALSTMFFPYRCGRCGARFWRRCPTTQ